MKEYGPNTGRETMIYEDEVEIRFKIPIDRKANPYAAVENTVEIHKPMNVFVRSFGGSEKIGVIGFHDNYIYVEWGGGVSDND